MDKPIIKGLRKMDEEEMHQRIDACEALFRLKTSRRWWRREADALEDAACAQAVEAAAEHRLAYDELQRRRA